MGLAFHFCRCKDAALAVALKRKATRAWWKGSHETFYALKKILKDPHAPQGVITEVEIPSRRHPKVTIRDFGGSWGGGGSSFLPSMAAYGLPGYEEIFRPPTGKLRSPWFIPDWDRALIMTREALQGMNDRRKSKRHFFQVQVSGTLSSSNDPAVSSARKAMEVFENEWKRTGGYSKKNDYQGPYTGHGFDFHPRGWKVHGLILGTYLNSPCVYAVYSNEKIFESHFKTLQQLEEILLHIRREGRQFFFIDWSD